MTRKADLSPPLGYPGGPCHVVQRIHQKVRDPRLKEKLDDQVEVGRDLSNPEAVKIYRVEDEKGPGGFIKRMQITPHAQYRMDLRGIVVPEVRLALQSFLKMMYAAKAKGGWEYEHYGKMLSQGQTVEWTDERLGLSVSFVMGGRDTVRIVTVYWKGEPDPSAPGLDNCKLGYSRPVSDLPGTKTYVKDPAPTKDPEPSKPLFPRPERGQGGNIPIPSYSRPEGVQPRTKGTPGRPHSMEPASPHLKRRPGVTAEEKEAITVRQQPVKRQRKQRGIQRQKARMYYRKNRNKARMRSKLRYRKLRNNPSFKKQQQIRRKNPERFKRRTSEVLTTPEIAFVVGRNMDLGHVRNVSPMTGLVTFWREKDGRDIVQSAPLSDFLDHVVFLSDEDIDAMFDLVDAEFGFDQVADEFDLVEGDVESIDQWMTERVASRYLAKERTHKVKLAARISDILAACDQALWDKAKQVRVKLKRVDARNAMWHFAVKGSKDDYLVRVQAKRQGNVRDMRKVDVLVACSCPFWQFQGPEHWAKESGYLYGKPTGTASRPNEKDPGHKHGACKHVLAVFEHITSKGYQVLTPKGKAASGLRYLADTLATGEVWGVWRYRPGQNL